MPRILIAEDERVTNKLMAHMLKRFGECSVALDGAEALALFESAHQAGRPYDIVFLDIHMPQKNGQEVLNAIRDYEAARGIGAAAGVKVVVSTVCDDSENVLDAHVSGCCAYLVKPVSPQMIEDLLGKLLQPEALQSDEF